MASLVEPKQLRLPREILVLQPMHGHLDLDPMLLGPGTRCTIGAAKHCTARLTHAALVEEEHCVIEVIGRKTMLTSWAHEATWLNDRLVTEPRELIDGDRVAIGPFDFRLRSALPSELIESKLVPPESRPLHQDSTPLGAGVGVSLGSDLKTDLITELSRRNPRGLVQSAPEQMTQHVSSLLGDLQNQVQLLQEKDAELNGQIRQRRESPDGLDSGSRSSIVRAVEATRQLSTPSNYTASQSREAQWKKQVEQAAAQLQADRDALERDRMALISEQARYDELLKQIEQQQKALALAAEELESDCKVMQSEEDKLRQRTQQLSEKEGQLAAWENRLRETETTQSRQPEARSRQEIAPVEPELSPHTHRPLQTFLTLIAFTSAALLLGVGIGDPEVSTNIGWTTAILGAISTVDLLCRRWFGVS